MSSVETESMSVTKTKRSRQNNPRTYASKKDRYKNEDKNRWRKVFVWLIPLPFAVFVTLSIAQGKIEPVWAVLSVVNIIVYVVFLLEWYVYKIPAQRRWLRGIGLLISIAVIVAGVAWKSRMPSPIGAFTSRVVGAPLGSYEATRGGVFFLIYNRGEGEIVTPAQLGLYMEIINQQAHEALIDSYIVEAQNTGGEWFRLIRLDAGSSPVFLCIEDFQKAKPLDLSNGLDRQLRAKPITAHGTVRGWAFFELPQNIRENSLFRVTVEDNNGKSAQTADNEALPPTKDYVQSVDLRLAAGVRDLSASRFMMYSELFKERIPN